MKKTTPISESHHTPPELGSSVLFEMLRSFVALAKTQRLSAAVKILKSSRQTVMRHVEKLEELRGEKLLEFKNQRYVPTQAGERALAGAEALLIKSNNWFRGKSEIESAPKNPDNDEKAPFFFAQQHPIDKIWQDGKPLLRYGLEVWSKAKGELETPQFEEIRPYTMIFRPGQGDWICIEIGEKSGLARRLGWAWAKSAAGKFIGSSPENKACGYAITQAYDEVSNSGGMRLDHFYRELPDDYGLDGGVFSYQRLLLACKLPDGQPALANIIDLTYDVSIDGQSKKDIRKMPDGMIIDFDPQIMA